MLTSAEEDDEVEFRAESQPEDESHDTGNFATRGAGYTAHVLPSSSAWVCPVQAWAGQLG